MGEIRFVGTGETPGYPYLACKKNLFMINSCNANILVLSVENKNLIKVTNYCFLGYLQSALPRPTNYIYSTKIITNINSSISC